MSRLLFSASMVVVAFMAFNQDLVAAGIEDPFYPIMLDKDQSDETAADEIKLKTEEQISSVEEAASEGEMKALEESEETFSPEAKGVFEELKMHHELLDKAIERAQEAESPEEQQEEFMKVEEALSEVEDSANQLAEELKSDPMEEKAAEAIAHDSADELSEEKVVLSDKEILEKVDETKDESERVADDAMLTPGEDLMVANEMKYQVNEIKNSTAAAEEIQKGLEDAGLDAQNKKIIALRKALENLQAILFDIIGAQKKTPISKK